VRKLFTILSGLAAAGVGSIASAGQALAAKAEPWQMGLPDPVTPLAHQMADFHNYWLLPIITVITIFVLVLLLYVCWRFRESANPVPSKTTHNSMLEVLWTGIPVLILVVMAFPSLKLLYATDEVEDSEMTVKIVGHQWYWEYQYPDHGNFFIEARIAATTEEEAKEQDVHRLMATDEMFVLPADTKIRLQMTSADVIHNWSMSDFGVRMDTVPGRLNEAWTQIDKPGIYYGFCSELCGDAHAFMPIQVQVLPKAEFAAWVEQAREKYDPVEQAQAPSVSRAVATSPAQAVE
jgi:cytochrome c oxidase subunit 2|tara:strand:- start:56685 stop:57560 length:876 start_codon:yes stop_codon:yes gene_type:complete